MSEKLLDYVFKISGEAYLSNLRVAEVIAYVLPDIKKISESAYSLKEWNDLLSYIFGENITCHSIQEAKAFLERSVL